MQLFIFILIKCKRLHPLLLIVIWVKNTTIYHNVGYVPTISKYKCYVVWSLKRLYLPSSNTVYSRPQSSFIVGNTISNFTTSHDSHPDFRSEINSNQRCRKRRQTAGFSIQPRLRLARKNCLALWPIHFPSQSTPDTILYTALLPLLLLLPLLRLLLPLMILPFWLLLLPPASNFPLDSCCRQSILNIYKYIFISCNSVYAYSIRGRP